jgi:hypothetical protein
MALILSVRALAMARSLERKAPEHTASICRSLVLLEHFIGVVPSRIGRQRLFGDRCCFGDDVDMVHLATING